jgi:hypothetical protein
MRAGFPTRTHSICRPMELTPFYGEGCVLYMRDETLPYNNSVLSFEALFLL